MKLYRPVLIESAEQAEALPVGTPAYIDVGGGPARYSAVKTPAGDWFLGGREYHEGGEIVGWTALVPIEAEEETTERHRLCQAVPDVLHRYTTPWTLYTPKEDPQ